jgi:hypothetical protein
LAANEGEAKKMTKIVTGPPDKIAEIIIQCAKGLTEEQFANFLERALVNVSSSDAASIARYLPLELQGYLPKRCMH